ncbi:hypothetical protein DFA_04484 [Cavenderia fasciculata]|uniref:Glutathione S-transferase n=1 Tax=Cavenderia fasciculata TaxID=261658 RepID=F4PPQ3_CACFS|nr:uncharacterized protein DFA_04484 [Cavenderia fasciculata]EGG22366.1 hypothetical protein DFA_04484 [Cavenderia fasciculata]|eukprot:XP_004360217.1 hypothetical protein DFA_04484 [Cavenderia fasciculata]
MSQPTFYYFDGRGKGELIRLLLTYFEVKFTDIRINDINELPQNILDQLPFGQVPYYIDEKIQLSQSLAIQLYLANKFNFTGGDNNEEQKAISNSIVNVAPDVLDHLYKTLNLGASVDDFKNKIIPKFVGRLETLLTKNGGKFFVGTQLSYADLAIFNVVDNLLYFGFNDQLSTYTNLLSQHKSISSLPQLVSYLENRPKATF